MNKSAYWSVCIINCASIICWTVIAITFNKWWLALFMSLCMCGVKNKTTNDGYRRICDGCGAESPVADSREEAIREAAKIGWVTVWDLDYCPECQKKQGRLSDD